MLAGCELLLYRLLICPFPHQIFASSFDTFISIFSSYLMVMFTGTHMALGMAVGLLFLGGGRMSLQRSPLAIAALMCATYPRFPTAASDNAFHVQAFRHLYVLAAENRLVRTLDVDTGAEVHVPLQIRVSTADGDQATIALATPCLLPEVWSSFYLRVLLRVACCHCECDMLLSRTAAQAMRM